MASHALDPFPLDGPTDFDGEDVVVERLPGDLGAAIVPSALQRLAPEQKAALSAAMDLVHGINDLQEQLAELVDELRQAGVSWRAIGWAVGTTGEAARQRFGVRDD